ncbi:uncharacterized protein [Aegilops tauschii subsp. strangulata]|uniref:uncharacterized protein n=1 Tax=Aegilops tauschii subsp. strangulata TaxID=200361 RepID=UPI00098B1E14
MAILRLALLFLYIIIAFITASMGPDATGTHSWPPCWPAALVTTIYRTGNGPFAVDCRDTNTRSRSSNQHIGGVYFDECVKEKSRTDQIEICRRSLMEEEEIDPEMGLVAPRRRLRRYILIGGWLAWSFPATGSGGEDGGEAAALDSKRVDREAAAALDLKGGGGGSGARRSRGERSRGGGGLGGEERSRVGRNPLPMGVGGYRPITVPDLITEGPDYTRLPPNARNVIRLQCKEVTDENC